MRRLAVACAWWLMVVRPVPGPEIRSEVRAEAGPFEHELECWALRLHLQDRNDQKLNTYCFEVVWVPRPAGPR